MKTKQKVLLILIPIVLIVIIAILIFMNKNNSNNDNNTNIDEGPLIVPESDIKITPTTDNTRKGEFTKSDEEWKIENISEKFKETKQFEGLEIKNITLESVCDDTEFTAEVTNNTESDKKSMLVNIVLYNKDGTEMAKIPGIIGDTKAGETIQMKANISEGYANAYDFKLEIKQ